MGQLNTYVFCYPTPMKKGEIYGISPVVSWKVPATVELTRLSTAKGLTSEDEIMKWDWATKIQNTRIFSLYLERIKRFEERDKPNRADPSKYHGPSLPTVFIETEMENLRLESNGLFLVKNT